MSTYHAHLDTLRQLQVELLVTNASVFFIQLEEFTLLEEQDCIVVVLLDLPKLLTS